MTTRPIKPLRELQQAVSVIADQLEETDPQPLATINRAIQVLGLDAVCRTVDAAKAAHASASPPMVADGSRPRTLGGCFFRILRGQLSGRDRRGVFPWKRLPVKAKQGEADAPAAPVVGDHDGR